jgi:predicted GNAT superfamily acetyltransferase
MGIIIRPVTTPEGYRALLDLEQRVWNGVPPMREDILLVVHKNGGLVLGAFDVSDEGAEKMIGLLFGYVGRTPAGRFRHWSHLVGVDAAYRDQHVGYHLKLAQREYVRAQGLDEVAWSYDPLLSRNAHLNIHRLGAVCRIYERNFYGEMTDAQNSGTPSDRFEAEWYISSAHVDRRLAGCVDRISVPDLSADGVEVVNPVPPGGSAELPGAARPLAGRSVLVRIPGDFHALKRRDPALARAWREHTADLFELCFARGYLVTDFLRDEQVGYYLLQQGWLPD